MENGYASTLGSKAGQAAIIGSTSLPARDLSPSEMETLLNRLNDVHARVCSIFVLTNTVADRVFGSQPSGPESAGLGTPSPCGSLYEAHSRIDAINQSLDRLAAEAERLNRL